MPILSIILINYNSSAYTVNCVRSIREKVNPALEYEIIVVDNNSAPEDVTALTAALEKDRGVLLFKSHFNAGFGGGNMMGVQLARGEFLAFVNNDSLLRNDCFSIIIDAMRENPEFGICGPKAFKEDGTLLPTLDHFTSLAKTFLGRSVLEKLNPKKYPNRKKNYEKPQRAQFVAGSFMVVRAADFLAAGGFDTNIFLYHEETDLCRRLAKVGKYAYLVPEAEFVHYHGGSTPRSVAIKTELKLSQLYVIRKHEGFWAYQIVLNYFRIRYAFVSLFRAKYRSLFGVLLRGAHLSESLRVKGKGR